MKKLLNLSIKTLLLTALMVIPVSGAVLAKDQDINTIVVAPNVISLESNGGSIHVHTGIGGIPDDVTLYVNDVEVMDRLYLFTDSCGNLVVKCSITTVKGMVTVGEDAEFYLTYSRNGNSYTTDIDYVPIIQVIPQKS